RRPSPPTTCSSPRSCCGRRPRMSSPSGNASSAAAASSFAANSAPSRGARSISCSPASGPSATRRSCAPRAGRSCSRPGRWPAPPPFLFGTLGAIIRMRSPARDRNSLFDIAAAGPLAGLVIAVPALILGLTWSTIVPEPPQGHVVFGGSLLMGTLTQMLVGPIPRGMMLFTHPMADAAWVGFFVTALNLFPVGQLDGGRIAYALFGRRHRLVGVTTFAALLALGVVTGAINWMVWAALLFFLVGFHHSPPIDDVTPLTPGRWLVGVICLLLLVLLIPPVPIQIS